jgi:hypothetical protein
VVYILNEKEGTNNTEPPVTAESYEPKKGNNNNNNKMRMQAPMVVEILAPIYPYR